MADTWHIVSNGQRQITQLAPNGTGFVDVVEITYQIDSGPATGNTFTARIPAALYNADYVAKTIQGQVDLHNSIAGL